MITREEIESLKTGDKAIVTLTRLYWPEPKVLFHGLVTLHIQNGWKNSILVSFREPVWAESMYPNDYDSYSNSFVVEDYQMEIHQIIKRG